MDEEEVRGNIVSMTTVMIVAFLILILLFFWGCTLSFQNVMTSGTASDIVDSTPTTDTKADARLTIPAL